MADDWKPAAGPRVPGGRMGRAIAWVLIVLLMGGGAWIVVDLLVFSSAASSSGGQEPAGAVVQDAAVAVGEPMPDFAAVDLNGEPISLAQFAGRPVWLTFAATWCADCRSEAPDIQAAWEAQEDDGAVVVSVWMAEDADTVGAYAEKAGTTFIHVPDPGGDIAAAYQVVGVPEHYFIDRNGVLRAVEFGILSRVEMDAALAAIS